MEEIEIDGIKIEKNIPLPSSGKWAQLLSALDVGDSFLAPLYSDDFKYEASRIRANTWTVGVRLGIKTKTRLVDGGLRVWRTE